MTELANSIEAILFYHAEPMTLRRLSQLLKRNENDVREALRLLEERLSSTGLRLLQEENEVTLGTAPFASALIEAITKEELSKDLSKASLETLAIVLYKGPITRGEIDYIRGVNSTFILRNLLVRGLVQKVDNPADQRSFLYKPTFQLLEYMGVAKITDLPEYEETLRGLEGFIATKEVPTEDSANDKESALSDSETLDTVEDDDDTFDDLSDVEADIAEEDEAGENYVDEELESHLKEDEARV